MKLSALKHQLQKQRAQAFKQFLLDGRANHLLRTLSKITDQILLQCWRGLNFMPKTRLKITLIALGGYGRRELFPYSDIDFLIVFHHQLEPDSAAALEQFIAQLWDLGLETAPRVSTLTQCLNDAKNDLALKTSLLDARYLAGSRQIFSELRQQFFIDFSPELFFQAKQLELKQRHHQYGDTPYALEPNCKESPGGLRDLHVILWMAKAAQLGNSWRELAKRQLITQAEARQLQQKERAFKDIRIRLHLQAQRREDRLLFDLQTPLAHNLGFKNNLEHRASEQFMQRYYWAAKVVTQLNQILLQNIQALLFPTKALPQNIHPHFKLLHGLIELGSDDLFIRAPQTILEIFWLMTEHPEIKGMTPRTLRALWHARTRVNTKFRQQPIHRALFLQILQAHEHVTRLTINEPNQRPWTLFTCV